LRTSVGASPVTVFFTSCCVIVEPPCTIAPAFRLAIKARTMDEKSIAPCS
jgi:hypothetical protein